MKKDLSAISFKDSSRTNIVITSSTPWHEPPRLRHQVAMQMSRFHNVLYIELPFGSSSNKEEIEYVAHNFVIFRFQKPLKGVGYIYKFFPLFHFIFNSLIVNRINRLVKNIGPKNILINFQHDLSELLGSPFFANKVYFCNDNFAGFQNSFFTRKMAQIYEDRVLKRSDLCFTISEPLKEKCAKASSNVELIFPGHGFSIPDNAEPVRDRTFPIRVMYMGYINNRLNSAWLKAISEESKLELTMIGPVQNEEVLADIKGKRNFILKEPMVGETLQCYLHTADVLIMPYDTESFITQANYGSCPNKLMQYIACGKPVVSADIKNLISFPDYFVYKTSETHQFIEAIFEAFAEDDVKKKQKRFQYAMNNTWDHRGEEMNAILERNSDNNG